MIYTVALAAREFGCLPVIQDNLGLCCVLRLCQILVRRLTLATGFLAASAILVLATIVNDWPIDQNIALAMRNLPGYPYSIRAAISLAVSVPDFRH